MGVFGGAGRGGWVGAAVAEGTLGGWGWVGGGGGEGLHWGCTACTACASGGTGGAPADGMPAAACSSSGTEACALPLSPCPPLCAAATSPPPVAALVPLPPPPASTACLPAPPCRPRVEAAPPPHRAAGPALPAGIARRPVPRPVQRRHHQRCVCVCAPCCARRHRCCGVAGCRGVLRGEASTLPAVIASLLALLLVPPFSQISSHSAPHPSPPLFHHPTLKPPAASVTASPPLPAAPPPPAASPSAESKSGEIFWSAVDVVQVTGGQSGPGAFVVLSGAIRRVHQSPDGTEQVQ